MKEEEVEEEDLKYLRYCKIIMYALPIALIVLFFGYGSYTFGINFLWDSYMSFLNFPALLFFTIIVLIWIILFRTIFKKAEKEILKVQEVERNERKRINW